MSLGVPAGRVSVVSKGKEQPFCGEENETAGSKPARALHRHGEVAGRRRAACRVLNAGASASAVLGAR